MVVLRFQWMADEGVWPFYGKRGLICGWIVFRVTILTLLHMVVQNVPGD